jgi:hypothetical protein
MFKDLRPREVRLGADVAWVGRACCAACPTGTLGGLKVPSGFGAESYNDYNSTLMVDRALDLTSLI